MKPTHGRTEGEIRSAGSPCRMEGLEPRLLLADELFIGIGDVPFRENGPQLPDDKIEVPVTVQNISAMQISGRVRIQIWASPDDVLGDVDDFLCFEGNININPRANEIQTRKVKARLPLDILPITYKLIVTVIDESMLPGDASFMTTEGVDDEVFGVRWQFGQVDGRSGNTTLKFMNNSGVVYKVNFSKGFEGHEQGEVESFYVLNREARGGFPGDQTINLQYQNTGFDDTISVRRVGGPSDPDLFHLSHISAFGTRVEGHDLGFFDASGVTLYDTAQFLGLHKLFLGNVLVAGEIRIEDNLFQRGDMNGLEPFNDRVSIKVKEVVGTLFEIHGTLANMQATSFTPEPEGLRGALFGGIFANTIEKVNIKNDYEGSVEVQPFARGSGESDRVVDAFIVGGQLSGVFFANGGVAKIQAGSIDDFEAAIEGRLERLIVKGDLGMNPLQSRGSLNNIIGATDISRVDITGSLFDTHLFAGLDFIPFLRGSALNPGDLYGGVISNAAFTSGIIGRINIGGDMLISQIAAGVDPNSNSFFDNDGFLVGDRSVSRIGPIKVGGLIGMANFVSGDFPDNVSIDGSSYSTMDDPDDIFVHVFPPI